MRKTIGIIGGMGPEATVDLYSKIVRLTPVKKEQDHIRIIIDNNPGIPDRTKAILKKGKSPLPQLLRSAKMLENAGADFIIIACNTAHYYYGDLKKKSGIPVINMVEEVAKHLNGKCGIAGLLATDGTVNSGIYRGILQKYGIKLVVPGRTDQKKVMGYIYGRNGIKTGVYKKSRIKQGFNNIISSLAKSGASTVIIGCTDIPVVLDKVKTKIPLLDANLVLARAAVKKALKE